MHLAPHRKPAIGFIFVTLMLDVLGFGLLIPVAPKLVESLLHGGTGGTEAEAAPIVALLMTTWYGISFLFAPTLGCLSDRVGRRAVILIALFGSGLDFFAQALAPTIGWFFVARAINGLSGASITAANAYIADITPPEKRAAAFGMMGAAFGMGFVFGPLIGGALGHYSLRLPFYVAGALTLINWFYGLFVLPESLPRERRSHLSLARMNPVGAYSTLLKHPLASGLAGALFLVNMAQFALHAVWVLYTGHRYHWTPLEVGVSLGIVGVGSAIVQGGLARKIIPRLGEPLSLLLGLAFAVLAYTGYGLATEGWMIYVIVGIACLGGIAPPAAQALITRHVRSDEQGTVQGAMTSLNSLAGIVGPLIGGYTFARFNADAAPNALAGAPFFASAALCAVACLVAALVLRIRRDETRPASSATHAPETPGTGETP